MKLTRSSELRSAGTCQSGEQVNWGHLSQREPSGRSPTSCCTSAIGPMRSSPEPLRPHYTPLPPWLPAGVPDSVKIQQLQGTHEFTRSNYSQVLSKEMDRGWCGEVTGLKAARREPSRLEHCWPRGREGLPGAGNAQPGTNDVATACARGEGSATHETSPMSTFRAEWAKRGDQTSLATPVDLSARFHSARTSAC